MKIIKYIILCALTAAAGSKAVAQTRIIESLKTAIYRATTAERKLEAIFLLCEQGYSLHADTLMAYADRAEKIAAAKKDEHAIVRAGYYKSAALTNKGLLDSSLNTADRCLVVLETKVTDPLLMGNVLNQKGRCYVRKNQYKQAVEMGYAIIAIAEKYNDVLLQVKAKTLIGWSYLEMGQLRDALNWHLKALRTTGDSLLLQRYAILFANIATNYNGLGNSDSAFFYIDKGVDYARKHENLFALSNSLAIKSALYVSAGKPKFSEPLLKEVVEIRRLIGDPFYIASDLGQLGYYYAHYGQPEKGIAACTEGIELARKYKLYTKLFFLYSSLADNYKAMGNTAAYSKVLEDVISLKDSVYEQNSATALAELNTKYELQKKENTIIYQKLDIALKNYWLYGGLAFFLFSGVVAVIIFVNYRKRQQLKMALALAEEKRLSNESVKEAEENERRRIAADLHDNLGAYAASIVANLDTISQQQQFNNTAINALKELHSNSQSIVSQLGDTIWALKRKAVSLTSISDRIKLVIQKVQPSYSNIDLDVEENIGKDYLLQPSQGFHLFQIMQEAISNALKHSNCTVIKVKMYSDETKWEAIVEDNGTGIKTMVSVKGGGNGIPNMQLRSKDANFSLRWSQNKPSGTRVTITSTTN
ncbi:MAG: histidine kinase [Ferruginibacter sp.]